MFRTFKFGIGFLKREKFSRWTWGYELGTYRSNKIATHHLKASHVKFRVVAQPVCRCITTTPTCPRRETFRLSWMLPQGIGKVNSRSESQLSWQNPCSQVATRMLHICSTSCSVMKRICSAFPVPSAYFLMFSFNLLMCIVLLSITVVGLDCLIRMNLKFLKFVTFMSQFVEKFSFITEIGAM